MAKEKAKQAEPASLEMQILEGFKDGFRQAIEQERKNLAIALEYSPQGTNFPVKSAGEGIARFAAINMGLSIATDVIAGMRGELKLFRLSMMEALVLDTGEFDGTEGFMRESKWVPGIDKTGTRIGRKMERTPRGGAFGGNW